ncbi:MAG: tRNA (N6-isopentenyl adenosine(37)-C2)-methylthiotransferase MiaB [Candidatus Marinimicrobia bacterium]|nr:tRNA (N6-isopentenyl adenosine(37)-C2)-methylthiotransferase MiaB [Candidatus Neomarinimicrobiota bacterium]|tara:strand:+ start:137 stop:1456 length:1320 start_codon:yes stop_codon:yes gene_type:complete
MGKYYLETFGCQMNVADSEMIEGILQSKNYSSINSIDKADIIFVNTCAIREHAEEKVHSRLGVFSRIKRNNPEVIIGVLGCMAQHLKDDILDSKPYVDIILGPDSYRKLPALLERKIEDKKNIVDTKLSRYEVYDNFFPSRKEGINAWISIMRGCDKFCTFCIVPFTRGRERSRSVNSIVNEVKKAVNEGFIEITLLGQNVNSYKYENHSFDYLLKEIAEISGVERLRYTSPHPEDMTDDVLYVMAHYDNICNAVHFPLQAGSSRILNRMNRTYTKNHFIERAHRIREILPSCGLTTDIIVGFPGETNSDFEETIDVMNKIKFDSAFTFKYSPRLGTKAHEYSDQISEMDKQERLEKVIKLQKEHTLIRNKEIIGNNERVLVEKNSKRSINQWAGRTDSNKWVIFDKENANIKDIVDVLITDAKGISLHGYLVKKKEAA